VVLSRRPGQVALDLDIHLPRTGLEPDKLRALPEYAALRATVSQAVRAAAA
jgi:taurine transport system ATP-binding protein